MQVQIKQMWKVGLFLLLQAAVSFCCPYSRVGLQEEVQQDSDPLRAMNHMLLYVGDAFCGDSVGPPGTTMERPA